MKTISSCLYKYSLSICLLVCPSFLIVAQGRLGEAFNDDSARAVATLYKDSGWDTSSAKSGYHEWTISITTTLGHALSGTMVMLTDKHIFYINSRGSVVRETREFSDMHMKGQESATLLSNFRASQFDNTMRELDSLGYSKDSCSSEGMTVYSDRVDTLTYKAIFDNSLVEVNGTSSITYQLEYPDLYPKGAVFLQIVNEENIKNKVAEQRGKGNVSVYRRESDREYTMYTIPKSKEGASIALLNTYKTNATDETVYFQSKISLIKSETSNSVIDDFIAEAGLRLLVEKLHSELLSSGFTSDATTKILRKYSKKGDAESISATIDTKHIDSPKSRCIKLTVNRKLFH